MIPKIQPSKLSNGILLQHTAFLCNVNSILICSRAWDAAVMRS